MFVFLDFYTILNNDVSMKKIGEGYYYNVFDLGNNRVLKKRKSKIRMFLYIMVSRRFHPNFIREYKNATNTIKYFGEIYKKIRDTQIDTALLGNPVFLNEIEYEQDKVQIIRPMLTSLSEQETKDLLDKYIISIKELWKYGIADKVYNFTINNGVNINKNVVLIDFNEVVFEKNQVQNAINEELWLKRWSYTHLSENIKQYYEDTMRASLTLESLDNLWGSYQRGGILK